MTRSNESLAIVTDIAKSYEIVAVMLASEILRISKLPNYYLIDELKTLAERITHDNSNT
jgi:hypothetical protein